MDHQFWKAGFSDENIFATQGDYGKIQCQKGCHPKTYDAVEMFMQMHQSRKDCLVPSYMVPKCPVCGGNMAMHLRCDQYFVEDEHWHQAAEHYASFLEEHGKDKVVLLELGVGFNTPTIIRFPFEQMMRRNENWSLIRLNLGEAFVPESFGERAVGIGADKQKVFVILQLYLARGYYKNSGTPPGRCRLHQILYDSRTGGRKDYGDC